MTIKQEVDIILAFKENQPEMLERVCGYQKNENFDTQC